MCVSLLEDFNSIVFCCFFFQFRNTEGSKTTLKNIFIRLIKNINKTSQVCIGIFNSNLK